MYRIRKIGRTPFFPYKISRPLISNMSTSGALYTSASLKAANALPYSSMEGKLDPMLLQALTDMKFDFMTPVQSKVLGGLPSLNSDWSVISKGWLRLNTTVIICYTHGRAR